MGALWHGFANMGTVEREGAFAISRGEGAYVWDTAGTRYLDLERLRGEENEKQFQ